MQQGLRCWEGMLAEGRGQELPPEEEWPHTPQPLRPPHSRSRTHPICGPPLLEGEEEEEVEGARR